MRFQGRAIFQKLVPPVLIVLVGLAAFASSFDGAFVFDDYHDIFFSHRVQRLGTSWQPAQGPWRPVTWFSLAVNYALGRDQVWGYHAVNVTVHILAALALYGSVRRTLLLDPYRPRWQQSAPWLALTVALLWMVHPLQTESVTYIVHRYESLMGMFYLLTLYCVIRGATVDSPLAIPNVPSPPSSGERGWGEGALQSNPPSPRPSPPEDGGRGGLRIGRLECLFWYTSAVFFCALGMGSKEVMVTAPFMVLLYDRVFLSESWGRLVRARWLLYAGLATTWCVILLPLTEMLTKKAEWVGFNDKLPSAYAYALSQPRVILHYLQLTFWPDPLCVDYRWPLASGWERIVPPLIISALVLGTLFALWRRSWLGFVGAWFFVILAPTSSFMPISDLAAERRTYLSLAAVIVLVVLSGHALLKMLGRRWLLRENWLAFLEGGVVAALSAALVWTTIQRNWLYHDPEKFWLDLLAQRPENERAHNNLGDFLLKENRIPEAAKQFEEAVRLAPMSPAPLMGLGMTREKQGRMEDALACYRHALAIDADYIFAHNNLGEALLKQGHYLGDPLRKQRCFQEAKWHFDSALATKPHYSEAHNNLGALYLEIGQLDKAREHLEKALALKPFKAAAYGNLGNLFLKQNDPAAALEYYLKALEIDPNQREALVGLGRVFESQGRLDEAADYNRRAVQLDPRLAQAHHNLGFVYLKLGRNEEAIASHQEAVRLQSKNIWYRLDLIDALQKCGKSAAAEEQYQEALKLDPSWPQVVGWAAWTLATHADPSQRKPANALRLASHACRATKRQNVQIVDILAAAYADNGRFEEAAATAQEALALAQSAGETNLAEAIQQRLELYRKNQPFRARAGSGVEPGSLAPG